MNRGRLVRPVGLGRPQERGTVIALTAMLLMGIMIMAALSVDVGHWYNTASRAQRASDLAALGSIEELRRVEAATGDRIAAEAAARDAANQILAENGFDPTQTNIDATVSFSTSGLGTDVANVEVQRKQLDLFFAGIVLKQVDVGRKASASVNDCGADCGAVIPITTGLTTMIKAGTGGDGWSPTLVGDQVFNLFHHSSGDVLSCTDKKTEKPCTKGAQLNFYPTEPYVGMSTNYTPKITAIGMKVYFVVQRSTSVGLGCWDSTTHATCSGYSNPKPLEAYKPNGGSRGNVRIDGPEAIGTRLYLFGDNSRMYCWDTATDAACPGYPAATNLTGSHELALNQPASGYPEGMKIDEIQFDMAPTPDGRRIFVSLTPVPFGARNNDTWVSCWDTVTTSPCSDFGSSKTSEGRPFLFVTYDRAKVVDGVCARAGQAGGSGTGHQCFRLNGSPRPSPFDFDFNSGDTPGQQSATGTTTFGHLRTFFPFRKNSSAICWDWTIGARCATAASNWTGQRTQEYAYIYDGNRCMYGLGHAGLLWTFDIDTGQWPCPGDGTGQATVNPCSCADGVTQRWTSLVLTAETDLADFDSFVVTVSYADGSLYQTVDLLEQAVPAIDLRPLNQVRPFPTSVTVSIAAEVKDGHEAAAIADDGVTGLRLLPGTQPILTS